MEDLEKGQYILVTVHRAENVDVKKNLAGILEGLEGVHRETGLPIIFPIHPRTGKMMTKFNLTAPSITLTKPLGYLEFLHLESQARLIITDSGGLQEESCVLGVPCVTLRENTERPETLDVGSRRPGRDRCTNHYREVQEHARQKTGLDKSLWRWPCRTEDGRCVGGGGVGGVGKNNPGHKEPNEPG